MDRQTWDDKTKAVDFDKCGTKTYTMSKDRDVDQTPNCAREVMVRTFLEYKNMSQYVTKLKTIEPDNFFNYILEFSVEDIQNKFFNVCEKVEKYIRDNGFETITLYIEKGDDERVTEAISEAISDMSNGNESKARNMINDIFTIIDKLHSIGVVHGDIKHGNFIYCHRGNEEVLLLNDFDNSYILPIGKNYITINKLNQILGVTVRYAAPEQYGVPEYAIGHATDVFSASMIAYTMLNGSQHPKEYDVLTEDRQYETMQKVFRQMNKNKQEFAPCKNGSKELKEIISSGIKINPAERPSAIRFLSIDNHQNTVPEIPTEVAEPSSPENKETEVPTEKKEEKPMDEQKNEQGNKNIDNRGGIIGDGNIIINDPPPPPDKHISFATVFIVILALVIVGVVALVVISKSGGDTNISNNVSVTASIAPSIPFEIETSEIPTEYITTVSSTTETTSEIIQSTETEKKKKILLQL